MLNNNMLTLFTKELNKKENIVDLQEPTKKKKLLTHKNPLTHLCSLLSSFSLSHLLNTLKNNLRMKQSISPRHIKKF